MNFFTHLRLLVDEVVQRRAQRSHDPHQGGHLSNNLQKESHIITGFELT